jgi:transcriptional regulator with XRE-family HTH domain
MKVPRKPPVLGKVIARILTQKGMSKAEFGRRVNTSRQNVSLILRKEHLDTQQLWKISEVLETDLFHLISIAFNGGDQPIGYPLQTGSLEIRLELRDTELIQLTADLVQRIVDTHPKEIEDAPP